VPSRGRLRALESVGHDCGISRPRAVAAVQIQELFDVIPATTRGGSIFSTSRIHINHIQRSHPDHWQTATGPETTCSLEAMNSTFFLPRTALRLQPCAGRGEHLGGGPGFSAGIPDKRVWLRNSRGKAVPAIKLSVPVCTPVKNNRKRDPTSLESAGYQPDTPPNVVPDDTPRALPG